MSWSTASRPLECPLEVTGPITVHLRASSSAPDTDFAAMLSDVDTDGVAHALADDILRARYRNGRTAPVLLTPGDPVELVIELSPTSNLFLPSHRIRLEIFSSNFPRFARNPNTGRPIAYESELRRAEQTVFHDGPRPSRVMLPIVPRDDGPTGAACGS